MAKPATPGLLDEIVSSLWEAGKDLLFPGYCLGCNSQLFSGQDILFCQSCFSSIRFLTSPLCHCCGLPFVSPGDHLCADCLRGKFVFARARAAVVYHEPVIAPILSFKYGGDMTALETFAALARTSRQIYSLPEPDIIVPVPLHSRRLRNRGFNQADLLAQCFFPNSHHKISRDCLHRIRYTMPQSGQGGRARRLNIRNAFRLSADCNIRGKTILLIDDVLTTGTTVNECSKILLAGGATRVTVFTLARAC